VLKTITTSKSEDGVFARVVLEFGCGSPQAKELVSELIDLQDEAVVWSVQALQTKMNLQ
jgi:hypothetical protein